jgi:hypothetical protein
MPSTNMREWTLQKLGLDLDDITVQSYQIKTGLHFNHLIVHVDFHPNFSHNDWKQV